MAEEEINEEENIIEELPTQQQSIPPKQTNRQIIIGGLILGVIVIVLLFVILGRADNSKPSSNKFLRNTSGGTLSWETVDTTTITVADESSDTSCYVAYFTDATGDLAPKTGTNLTFNSNTGALAATSFSGDGSALTGIAAAQGGSTDKIFWENGKNVTADYTITNDTNAGTFGPVTINNGVTVTVGSGETWTIV